jgi:hypothetical protein
MALAEEAVFDLGPAGDEEPHHIEPAGLNRHIEGGFMTDGFVRVRAFCDTAFRQGDIALPHRIVKRLSLALALFGLRVVQRDIPDLIPKSL